MAEIAPLTGALRQLSQLLDQLGVPYMVIGGIANLVWGEPRTTRDIDVTVRVADERLDELVQALGRSFTTLPEDPFEFIRQTRVLPLATGSGVRIDLIFAGLPYEEEAIRRAQIESIGGVQVRVASAEDLIVHKLVSERPRDREDAAGVIRRQRKRLDRGYLDPLVQSLADLLERPEMWDWYQREMQAGES